MRVLQVVKTSDGADWAAAQAAELVKLGVTVHVALPRAEGRTVQAWTQAGAVIHVTPTDLSVRRPWLSFETMRGLRDLIANIHPDLIHSHFVSSTMLIRLALGKHHPTPRLFQVPGPLHMEHSFWRNAELATAGSGDSWIASSRCIRELYRKAGVPAQRLYLSYYGTSIGTFATVRSGLLRTRFAIGEEKKIVGNANFIYPPKYYLGQRIGLKAHEDVIDALGMIARQRSDVVGVLIGGTFAGSESYERRLRARAREAGGRIVMTGYLPPDDIRRMWPDFDVAVHVPISENCGGVCEPLLAGVPTIASRTGGLPEVVLEGVTGRLVGVRKPAELARAVIASLDNLDESRRLAQNGQRLVRSMFDVRRTAQEVFEVYRHILDPTCHRPVEFDSEEYASNWNSPGDMVESESPAGATPGSGARSIGLKRVEGQA